MTTKGKKTPSVKYWDERRRGKHVKTCESCSWTWRIKDPTRPWVGGHGSPNVRRWVASRFSGRWRRFSGYFQALRNKSVFSSKPLLPLLCKLRVCFAILSVSFYNSKDASDVPSARLQTVIHYNIKRISRLTELTGKTNAGPLMSIDTGSWWRAASTGKATSFS